MFRSSDIRISCDSQEGLWYRNTLISTVSSSGFHYTDNQPLKTAEQCKVSLGPTVQTFVQFEKQLIFKCKSTVSITQWESAACGKNQIYYPSANGKNTWTPLPSMHALLEDLLFSSLSCRPHAWKALFNISVFIILAAADKQSTHLLRTVIKINTYWRRTFSAHVKASYST